MLGAIRGATIALVIAAVAIAAVPNVADAQMAGKAIDARRGLMKNTGKNMKVVAGFVKKGMGSASDVARSARMIASNIAQLPNHYPKGTAQGSGAGNTRAKMEIWTQWAKFSGAAAKATDMALKLAMAADTGDKAAIGAAMGGLGKSCGGCHKPFRGPKNK
jgi:cytochrome c556